MKGLRQESSYGGSKRVRGDFGKDDTEHAALRDDAVDLDTASVLGDDRSLR